MTLLKKTRAFVSSHMHLLQFFLFCSVIFVQTSQASGGYTSTGSRALADSNLAGDQLLAGDDKILIQRGSFEKALDLKKLFANEPSIVTGTLLDRKNEADPAPTRAILCAETQVHFIGIHKDGRTETQSLSLQSKLNLRSPRELRCAVNRANGEWAALNTSTGSTLINGNEGPFLGQISAKWTHIVFLNNSFFVLAEQGIAARIFNEHSLDARHSAEQVKAPWSNLENRDAVFARGSLLIRSGETQTSIVRLNSDSESIQWSNHTRIRINPCSEKAGCGVWMGEDERWIVGGSWGIYVGQGELFSRVQAPLLISDVTSPGVALNNALQKFIIVGDIDSDIRNLPQEAQLQRFTQAKQLQLRRESHGKRAQRFLVWRKETTSNDLLNKGSSPKSEELLFRYFPHSNQDLRVGEVFIHKGRLPHKWPASWVAVEEEIEFNELAIANEWIPNTPSQGSIPPTAPWWVDSVGFKSALEWIDSKKMTLSSLRVAVVDSGIDPEHHALKDVLDINRYEIPENGIDDDQNGLIDDIIGYDFISEQPTPIDHFGHGTHVAGLINNSWSQQGQLGGAYNTKLRIFRALDRHGKSNSIDLSRAIAAAIRSQVDLMNCSWGGGPETQALRDAFAAAKSAGILIFTSAGNDGLKTDSSPPVPKNFPGVLSIGASTSQGGRARFSNWGEKSVFAFAPGAEIISTIPTSKLGEKSGTSMASPIAASAGALILGAVRNLRPEWSQEQQNQATKDILCGAANKIKPFPTASLCGQINVSKSFERLEREGDDLRSSGHSSTNFEH